MKLVFFFIRKLNYGIKGAHHEDQKSFTSLPCAYPIPLMIQLMMFWKNVNGIQLSGCWDGSH